MSVNSQNLCKILFNKYGKLIRYFHSVFFSSRICTLDGVYRKFNFFGRCKASNEKYSASKIKSTKIREVEKSKLNFHGVFLLNLFFSFSSVFRIFILFAISKTLLNSFYTNGLFHIDDETAQLANSLSDKLNGEKWY